jgi:small subunit ribosomal protein S7
METQTVSSSSQARPSDALDDAALEQILYGGRPVTSQREGGLTEAQEEALYREGVIPPPEEAEAVLARSEAAAESQSIVSIETDVQKAGHKFGLPQKPYPEGFHVKKRYHPVLEQITRLLMRHGELSVAQRVCMPSACFLYHINPARGSLKYANRRRTWPQS